jgi:hypothetical protein
MSCGPFGGYSVATVFIALNKYVDSFDEDLRSFGV